MADTKNANEKIEAIVGQQVQITIQSMAGSTGYSWMITQLEGGLGLMGTSVTPVSIPGNAIGPVNQTFLFLALKEGKYILTLELIAPWRPGEAAAQKTYEVEITAPKTSAADEIAASLQGREFINPATVNVCDNATQVVKYAAPMVNAAVCGPQVTPIAYAAPMVNPAGIFATPVMPYAAPVTNMGANGVFTSPQVVYAAPMVTSGPVAAQPASLTMMYGVPWPWNLSSSALTSPIILYAAPMISTGPAAAQNTPFVVYSAPMSFTGPNVSQIPQLPGMLPGNQLNPALLNTMAVTMVAYAAPVLGGLYNRMYGIGYPGCC